MKREKIRMIALVLALVVFCGFFVFRLTDYQIVNGDEYKAQATQGYTRTVTLKAPRGEIVDRNGEPLVSNRVGFNIQLDKVYLDEEKQNDVTLSLINLMDQEGQEYNDSLPMAKTAPYTFDSEQSSAVDSLKEDLGLNLYATEQNVMDALIEEYDIVGYSPDDTRKIAGVRYEMEKMDFSISIPFVFAEDVSFEVATKIQENAIQYPGVDAVETPYRQYEMDDFAPHILGTVSPIYAEEYYPLEDGEEAPSSGYTDLKSQGYAMNDTVGRSGIEWAAEENLRGTDGKRIIHLDADGNVISVEEEPAVSGNTVMLTLDKNLQIKVQNLLADFIENTLKKRAYGDGGDVKGGAAIVMNVKTGEILASVSYPSYTMTEYNTDYSSLLTAENTPLLNRAFYGQYRPGSTFKPSVGLSALAADIIGASDTVNCTGKYTYYSDYQPTCMGVHGATNIVHALEVSCNIYFYDVGRRLGIDKLNEYVSKLGFGQKTGVEIGEATGVLSSPEYRQQLHDQNPDIELWQEGNTMQAAIGQLDTQVTPLQMVTAISTIANGGTRYQSHLIKSIKSYDMSETIQDDTPVVLDTIETEEENFQAVRDGMLASSLTGTSRSVFANYSIKIASKTGTPENTGTKSDNIAYVAFGPYEDPEIAVAICIEQGGSGYYAAPLCRDIFDAYFYPDGTSADSSTTSSAQ